MLVYILVASLILLLIVIVVLLSERGKIHKQIQSISFDIDRILTNETDEKIMLFTSEKKIVTLIEQMNRALERSRKA